MTTAADADQVVVLHDAVTWGFDDRGPFYSLGCGGSYVREVRVDPAPCYAHEVGRVQAALDQVTAVAPLPMPLRVHVLSHEVVSRTNGEYADDHDYTKPIPALWEAGADGRGAGPVYQPVGWIALSGKRIPPHPAMTRYLVAHEYGHAVAHHVARVRHVDYAAVKQHYMAWARPDATLAYGPGQWHRNVGELIANDFRVVVAGVEPEFWPHAGFERPEGRYTTVIRWWQQAAADCGWPERAWPVDPDPGVSGGG